MDIDPVFLRTLQELACKGGEVAFERIGDGGTTYPLHGVVVSVNPLAGTIHIQRTRTHAGQLHEMGLRYFLEVTLPTGQKISNSRARAYLSQLNTRLSARERAIQEVMESPYARPHEFLQTAYDGVTTGNFRGLPAKRFVYVDKHDRTRQVEIIAKSRIDADWFMASQDLYMALDDTLLIAIKSHAIWPTGIAYVTESNPSAPSVPWMEIFKALDGLPTLALEAYLRMIRKGTEVLANPSKMPADIVDTLLKQGLLQTEAPPSTSDEAIGRMTVTALRQWLRANGVKSAAKSREELLVAAARTSTPDMLTSALLFVRPPRIHVRAPCNLSVRNLQTALEQMRDSIFNMRQWLRGNSESLDIERVREVVARWT
ncbi:MAG: hypothetical protein WBA58_16985 [Giesbergeria sp.]|jgi:hypothetical protein